MSEKVYLVICCMIVFSQAAKLRPHLHLQERSTSPTISVQKFDGNRFYDFVKLAEASRFERNQREEVDSGKGEYNENLSDSDEDDTESSSIPPNPTTVDSIVVAAAEEDVTGAPTAEDAGSPTSSDQLPASSADQTPSPGDAVPGQPGDDPADSPSSSSSSSESSSSSSSSSEEEFRSTWEKAWELKLRNELSAAKYKDSHLPAQTSHRKYAKTEKFLKRQ